MVLVSCPQIPRSLCVVQTVTLLTEAEVQRRALCDWRGGSCTGYSTGRDAAILI